MKSKQENEKCGLYIVTNSVNLPSMIKRIIILAGILLAVLSIFYFTTRAQAATQLAPTSIR